MLARFSFVVLFVLIYNFGLVSASEGDRSPFYENCVRNCMQKNCTDEVGREFKPKAAQQQDRWAWLLGWDCREECRYHCMWRTVSAYEERGFAIPKFHGKWPFERIYGVQEPASAMGSAMNLLAHVAMYKLLVQDPRFSIKYTPLMIFWHLFFFVCAHAWTWSTLFHMRDTPFTEFMDYACALSMVMALFVAAIMRLFYWKTKTKVVILLLTAVYFVEHVWYLYGGAIDYEYNMTVNIIVGMLGTALWMVFALGALCGGGGGGGGGGVGGLGGARRYVWRLVVFCKLSGAAVLLELFDFPPLHRFWDSHALWHFATSPLPFLFYRFVIDDLDYMQTTMKIESKTDVKRA